MRKFATLLVLLLMICGVANAQQGVSYYHSSSVPTGSCTSNSMDVNDSDGSLYTCVNGSWRFSLNTSAINNTVWMDGVKYPYTAAGLRQAVIDANGHSGLAGVVRIGSTANGILTNNLQQIELDGNTIVMPSFTYIIGDGRDATGIDFVGSGAGTNSAFDFPPGTHQSGIMNLGIELDGGVSGTCFTFEGNATAPTGDNLIQNVSCGNGFTTGVQQGIVLTPTPTGANGANYIHDNIFQNVLFFGYNGNGVKIPVLSNGDYSDKFSGITSYDPEDNNPVFSGHFINDRLELTVHKQDSVGVTALSLASDANGNIVDLYCDLSRAAGNDCINDAAGGNHIVVSNLNVTPLGSANPNSFTENLTIDLTISPYKSKASVYLPMDTRSQTTTFSGLGAAVNGMMILCSDCKVVNPCTGGGTGALAKGINGMWVCN